MSITEQKKFDLTFPMLSVEQVHGALLGAAIGDALGWPQEQNAGRLGNFPLAPSPLSFRSWKRKRGRFDYHEEDIAAGEYSDDTQLILATARSILRGENWAKYLSYQELPLWLLYERGGGGATKRAAACWNQGISPWRAQNNKQVAQYFNAGGNGVAMRILPHVLVQGQTQPNMRRDVMRNGILTHGHPRALLGALVYAQAAWWVVSTPSPLPFGGIIQFLLEHQDTWECLPETHADQKTEQWLEEADYHFDGGYQAVWQKTVEEIREGLLECQQALEQGALTDDRAVLDQLGCFRSATNGSGVVAALSVLYLFSMYASQPETGLRTIAFAKQADTDTLASMLGGLFGLTLGLDWIPSTLHNVQDYKLIAMLASRLVHNQRYQELPNQTAQWGQEQSREVLDLLLDGKDLEIDLGSLGHASIQFCRTLQSTKNVRVRQWQLCTTLSQTLYIKRIDKNIVQKPRSSAKKLENDQPPRSPAIDSGKNGQSNAQDESSTETAKASYSQYSLENLPLKKVLDFINALTMLANAPHQQIPDSLSFQKAFPIIMDMLNCANGENIRSIVERHTKDLSENEKDTLVELLSRSIHTSEGTITE